MKRIKEFERGCENAWSETQLSADMLRLKCVVVTLLYFVKGKTPVITLLIYNLN